MEVTIHRLKGSRELTIPKKGHCFKSPYRVGVALFHGPSWQEPFAHPLAIARQTEKWPDVVATCGAGTVLVEPKAFEETPGRKRFVWQAEKKNTRMSMEVIVTIVSKLGYFTYLGDVSNLLILGLGHLVTKYHGHPSSNEIWYRSIRSRPHLKLRSVRNIL